MKICPTCGACSEDAYDLCAFDGTFLDVAFAGPRVLAERYLLEQRVAAGAMGVVYRALHLQIGSTVAVKLMQPRRDELQVGLARFHREAQILGQIKHPHAVLVMDFGVERRASGPLPYLVTEYLRGQALSTRLEEVTKLSLEEAAAVVLAICDAVDEAHEVGVIHRDLKPSNIFLERLRDGTEIVKVLDFGIAKFVELTGDVLSRLRRDHAEIAAAYQEAMDLDLLDEVAGVRRGDSSTMVDSPRAQARKVDLQHSDLQRSDAQAQEERQRDATLTEAGFMIGTIPYMAPEQMTGERVSRQTDLYAIASLLYRLLAGRLPFVGTDDEVINAKVSDERPVLAEISPALPSALAAVLESCFALDPAERPSSVRALSAVLRDVTAGASLPAASDLALELAIQLGALGKLFGQTSLAVEAFAQAESNGGDEAYLRARDLLLALDHPLRRVQRLVDAADPERCQTEPLLKESLHDFGQQFEALATVTRPLVLSPLHDYAEYLGAIWNRAGNDAAQIVARLQIQLHAEKQSVRGPVIPAPVTDLFGGSVPGDEEVLAPLIADLERHDLLLREDAFYRLIDDELERTARVLLAGRADASAAVRLLARGLWPYADRLLLAELYGEGRVHRLLPTLSSMDCEEARVFARLGSVFTGAPQGSDTAHGNIEEVLSSIDAEDERAVLWRCLLAHPLYTVRALAAQKTALSDFWSVATHPRVRAPILRPIFVEVVARARPEYMKVFFLCVHDQLSASASGEELEEAFLILQSMFAVPCFAEDVVFEPLLDLDRTLRERAAATGTWGPPEAYSDEVAAFTARGVSESMAPSSMRDVPLAVQRKLAREGHFLAYFACHTHEQVAKETVPHLLKREDIIRFLRLSTLHRSVLVDVARERRFFRKDQARLALLQNPRTPASIARVYLPLVPHQQVRLLASNRHIGAEVRALAATFMQTLEERQAR